VPGRGNTRQRSTKSNKAVTDGQEPSQDHHLASSRGSSVKVKKKANRRFIGEVFFLDFYFHTCLRHKVFFNGIFIKIPLKTGHEKLIFLQGFIRQLAETLFTAYTGEKEKNILLAEKLTFRLIRYSYYWFYLT
jgi:hypothetical protein